MNNALINHYRVYMKFYGYMIMELAENDEEILQLINAENPEPLLQALRDRIEASPVYE